MLVNYTTNVKSFCIQNVPIKVIVRFKHRNHLQAALVSIIIISLCIYVPASIYDSSWKRIVQILSRAHFRFNHWHAEYHIVEVDKKFTGI